MTSGSKSLRSTGPASLVLLLVLAATSGCGYVKAGEWEDDPANWERAFNSKQPEGVTVVHSFYWRAPHWTWEGGYYFEIAANAKLQAELFETNSLERAPIAPTLDGPAWFAPKPSSSYEVWRYADEPRSNFHLLIDLEDGTLFLADSVI